MRLRNISVIFLISFLLVSCNEQVAKQGEPTQPNYPTKADNVLAQEPKELKIKTQVAFDPFNQEMLVKNLQKSVPIEQIQVRKSLAFIPNTLEPFNGSAANYYSNEQVKSLIFFNDGLVATKVGWHENGTLSYLVDFDLIKIGQLLDINLLDFWTLDESVASRIHGRYMSFYRNGQNFENANLKHGSLIGDHNKWNKNGQLIEKSTYDENSKRIAFKLWSPVGQPEYESLHNKDDNYVEREWHPNGQLRHEVTTTNDGIDLVRAWYKNGQLQAEGKLKDNLPFEMEIWLPDGLRCPRTNLTQGCGLTVEYNEDGEIVQELLMSNSRVSVLKIHTNGNLEREDAHSNEASALIKRKNYDTSSGQLLSSGTLVNHLKQGMWKFYDNIQQAYEEIYYINDLKANGFVELPSEGLAVEAGIMLQGKRAGMWTIKDTDGRVIKEVTYSNGKLEGQAIYHHEDGRKVEKGLLSEGEKQGLWREYLDDVQTKYCYYDNGEPMNGISKLSLEDGTIVAKGLMNNGVKVGLWEEDTPGRRDGKFSGYYDENGLKTGIWKNTSLQVRYKEGVIEQQIFAGLAIDDTFSEFPDYERKLYTAIQSGWRQEIEFFEPTDNNARVAVTFTIDSNGCISRTTVTHTTASEIGSFICENAITKRSPFRSWSSDMISVIGKKSSVIVIFSYPN